jgi:hypothetical protein
VKALERAINLPPGWSRILESAPLRLAGLTIPLPFDRLSRFNAAGR